MSIEIVYDFREIYPFEVLESSESFGIGKGFVIDRDNRDVFVGDSISSVFAEKYILYSEISLLYEFSTERILTQKQDDTDDEERECSSHDFSVPNDFFKIHTVGLIIE